MSTLTAITGSLSDKESLARRIRSRWEGMQEVLEEAAKLKMMVDMPNGKGYVRLNSKHTLMIGTEL